MKIELQEAGDDGWNFVTVIDDMGTLQAMVNPDGDYLEGVTFSPSPLTWDAIQKAIKEQT